MRIASQVSLAHVRASSGIMKRVFQQLAKGQLTGSVDNLQGDLRLRGVPSIFPARGRAAPGLHGQPGGFSASPKPTQVPPVHGDGGLPSVGG